jgi:hypothetical protein
MEEVNVKMTPAQIMDILRAGNNPAERGRVYGPNFVHKHKDTAKERKARKTAAKSRKINRNK